jgi:hypothetical protein
MPTIKVSLSATEEIQTRQVAARQGCSIAEVARRGIQHILASASSYIDNAEAVIDATERRNGQGKRVVSAMLSPPLSGAVARIARNEKRSESSVLRELIRFELRRRGELPSKQWGAANAIAEQNVTGHVAAQAYSTCSGAAQ